MVYKGSAQEVVQEIDTRHIWINSVNESEEKEEAWIKGKGEWEEN